MITRALCLKVKGSYLRQAHGPLGRKKASRTRAAEADASNYYFYLQETLNDLFFLFCWSSALQAFLFLLCFCPRVLPLVCRKASKKKKLQQMQSGTTFLIYVNYPYYLGLFGKVLTPQPGISCFIWHCLLSHMSSML